MKKSVIVGDVCDPNYQQNPPPPPELDLALRICGEAWMLLEKRGPTPGCAGVVEVYEASEEGQVSP